jgi:hypothetical protein
VHPNCPRETIFRSGPICPSLLQLEDILELATFLQWKCAHNFAIKGLLSENNRLSSAHKLSLAISFRVTEWIDQPSSLLTTPLHKITLQEFKHLGSLGSHLVTMTQYSILFHCTIIVYNPIKPMFHGGSCLNMEICRANWESTWWGLAQHYLHPEYPHNSGEIVLRLEGTLVDSVTDAC